MDKKTKEARGGRLSKALDLKDLTQSEFRRRVERYNGLKIPSGHLSMMISGDRPIEDDYANLFADVLKIEPGFLKGFDNYTCRTYDEYLAFWSDAASIQDEKFKKVARVLVPLGYSVGMVAVDDQTDSLEFDIQYQGEKAIIPETKIDELFDEIQVFIKNSTNRLIKIYRDDSVDDDKEV